MRRGKAAKSEPSANKDDSPPPLIAAPTTTSCEGEDANEEKMTTEEYSKKQQQQHQHPLSYFDAVKAIGTVTTVENFWSLYNHLVRPGDLPTTTDYHFFREGIQPTLLLDSSSSNALNSCAWTRASLFLGSTATSGPLSIASFTGRQSGQ